MFDYDLWANERWMEAAKALGQMSVLEHVAAAQARWLIRCTGAEIAEPDDLRAGLQALNAGWHVFIEHARLTNLVMYTTSTGESFENPIHDIARQVINHGTYHRGDLRGRAVAAGYTDFPETDYILFVREP
jgi:uncharacterized damage-inducible protein DinB